MPLGVSQDTAGVVAVMALAGTVLCLLGYRIRYHGDLRLVSGYRPDRVTDPDAVAGLVGGGALVLGATTLAYGAAAPVVERGIAYWGSYTLVLVAGVAAIHLRGRRYVDGG